MQSGKDLWIQGKTLRSSQKNPWGVVGIPRFRGGPLGIGKNAWIQGILREHSWGQERILRFRRESLELGEDSWGQRKTFKVREDPHVQGRTSGVKGGFLGSGEIPESEEILGIKERSSDTLF